MKKTKIFCMILIVSVIFLSSCAQSQSVLVVEGIDNFYPALSNTGLTEVMLPKDFLELYPYTEGDFFYSDELVHFSYEKVLLYTKYDEETYVNAKMYALDNLKILPETEETLNGFTFYQLNYDLEKTNHIRKIFFAYSDKKCTVLVIGTRLSKPKEYNDTNLSEYIAEHFSFYDFEAGKINRTE